VPDTPTDPAALAAGPPARLDDRTVRQRLGVLDEQLAQLEATPGPIGELALAAVSGLAEIYGQALARALDLVDPTLVERMLGDELIGHLLVLHGIHPSPIEYRTSRVIEGMRATLFARGAEIELTGIEHGVAMLRLSAKGCGSGAAGIEQSVRGAVLAAVPELSAVTFVPAQRTSQAAFVPLDSLMRPGGIPHQR
jgi:Fe-S cluster biogenesis protein NfuA